MVTDPTTGQVKYISPADLFNALTFSQGLTKTGNAVELGGTITKTVDITLGTGGVLRIVNLPENAFSDTDRLMAVAADGTLKKVQVTDLLQSGDEIFTATATQATYPVANLPANATRVWVYRNGAKLLVSTDYSASAGTVTFTGPMAALVVAGDIIEVQWVK